MVCKLCALGVLGKLNAVTQVEVETRHGSSNTLFNNQWHQRRTPDECPDWSQADARLMAGIGGADIRLCTRQILVEAHVCLTPGYASSMRWQEPQQGCAHNHV